MEVWTRSNIGDTFQVLEYTILYIRYYTIHSWEWESWSFRILLCGQEYLEWIFLSVSPDSYPMSYLNMSIHQPRGWFPWTCHLVLLVSHQSSHQVTPPKPRDPQGLCDLAPDLLTRLHRGLAELSFLHSRFPSVFKIQALSCSLTFRLSERPFPTFFACPSWSHASGKVQGTR